MSFILDALRKSEHERQRSAVPGLAQVPLAAPQAPMPRWALTVIGVLGAAVLALGAAWWQSARPRPEPTASASTIERSVELPPPAPVSSRAPVQAAPAATEPPPESAELSLERAAASSVVAEHPAEAAVSAAPATPLDLPGDAAALPSVAALAAEGIALPPLRLELHAFSAERRDRFVFINGRKYVAGERLVEGPQLLSIEPTGAVLEHSGRRFLLVQE